ncbi:hypothetical protein TrRE_jg1055, partial [Triparma retinervis]
RGYSRTGVCRGHPSPVTDIDFSMSSRFLQSNDLTHNVMLWDQWGDAVSSRAEKLARTSCTVNPNCVGLWEDCAGGEVTSVNVDPTTSILCAGDNFGRLKLYNYPVSTGG